MLRMRRQEDHGAILDYTFSPAWCCMPSSPAIQQTERQVDLPVLYQPGIHSESLCLKKKKNLKAKFM